MKKFKLLMIPMIVLAVIGMFALSSSATEDTTPSLAIAKNTLELDNAVFMNFKVSAENIDDTSEIQLLVWEKAPTVYTKDSAQASLRSIKTEASTGYLVFQYDNLAAKDMTKMVYVCAYANVDGEDIYSKPVKFSIIQYAYAVQNTTSVSTELKNLLDQMLSYGATAQTYFNHNTDFLATDAVARIKVVNGTFEDGFTSKYCKAGASVTMTANAPTDAHVFSHWENSSGDTVGTNSTLTIAECVSDTYTAVYNGTYTITYDANGGNSAPVTQTKVHDESVVLSTNVPTREGYTFRGWATSADGEVIYNTGDNYSANKDLVLYAVWEIIDTPTIAQPTVLYRYREKYYKESSTRLDEPWVYYGSDITGYEHGKFNSERIFLYSDKMDAGIDVNKLNEEMNAKYCIHKAEYIYYYKKASGSWAHGTHMQMSQYSDGSWVLSGSPGMITYMEYTWCTQKTPCYIYYFYSYSDWSEWSDTPIMATDDIEVETKGSYVISYNANGGASAPDAQAKGGYETITLSSNIPTREGYTFNGWSTSIDGVVAYHAGDVYSANASITLYAVWSPNTYTITYDANGGVGAPAPQTKIYDITIALSTDLPMREGYTFSGWATRTDGVKVYNAGEAYSANTSITLFAVWKFNGYTITYDANGGTGAPEKVLVKNGSVAFISDTVPVRAGFTFLGWSTHPAGNMYSIYYSDGEITSYTNDDAYRGGKDVTLYAVWRVNDSSILGNKCGDNLYWSYDSSTYTLTITGSGAMYNFVEAPWKSYTIKTVYFPEGLLSIGNNAFAYSAVKNFTIPNTVVSIGAFAFYADAGLKTLHIPPTVQQICQSAFSGCNYLTSVKIECGGLIDIDTFSGCNRLSKVSIKGNITTIISRAFSDCNPGYAMYFELPQSLTWIAANSIKDTRGTHIYYGGSEGEWFELAENKLTNVTVYYYSESNPSSTGNYWHYDEDGNPTIW